MKKGYKPSVVLDSHLDFIADDMRSIGYRVIQISKNPKYAKVLDSERQGLEDLRSGKYKLKQ